MHRAQYGHQDRRNHSQDCPDAASSGRWIEAPGFACRIILFSCFEPGCGRRFEQSAIVRPISRSFASRENGGVAEKISLKQLKTLFKGNFEFIFGLNFFGHQPYTAALQLAQSLPALALWQSQVALD